jgi:uncharacterized protein
MARLAGVYNRKMSRCRLLTIVLLLVAAGGLAAAQEAGLLESLQPTGHVNDFAGVFAADQRQQLETTLRELDAKTGAQIAVVTLPALQGEEIRDFSNRLFERWGIGRRGDDRGMLFLAALEDRKIWVEVGYGLEGLFPDARVGRLLDEHVIPRFREGDYAGGLSAGALAAAARIAAEAGVTLEGAPAGGVAGPVETRPMTCGELAVAVVFLMVAAYVLIRHPWLLILLLSSGSGGRGGSLRSGGFGGGGFGGGGFGGFGGGSSGGGGAGRSW